jgi:HEAT repeat protein
VRDGNDYHSSYQGLNPNACFVLTYSVPLRKLYITGKEPKKEQWLNPQETADAIAAEKFYYDRKQKNPAELLKAFESWSPAVRSWAAEELASRPEGRKMEPQLLKLAEGSTPNIQEGACETLAYLKTPNAIPVFMRLLRSDNRWLRAKAAIGLGWQGPAARPMLPEILKIMADTAEPSFPISQADPVQIAQNYLSWTVFHGIMGRTFNNVDRKMLYPAIRVAAKLPSGSARANVRDGMKNSLSEADVRALAPELLEAINEPAPADNMFAGEIRMGALTALVKYQFQEAIPLCAKLNSEGSLQLLTSFGTAAQDYLPDLRQRLKEVDAMYNYYRGLKRPLSDMYKKYINAIESATTEPPLKSLSDPTLPFGKLILNQNLPPILPSAMKGKPGPTKGIRIQTPVQFAGDWTPNQTSPTPKAIDWSLPGGVIEAGRYAVTFQYTTGKSGYVIHQVEIVQDGKVVSQDRHEGMTNRTMSKDNVYYLDLPKLSATPLIFRATINTDAGNNSAGRILLEKKP